MALNDLLDHRLDAQNPRTQERVLPTGTMRRKEVAMVALISIAVFLVSCVMLSGPVALMALPVALLICLYPLTKRFTSLCHFVLATVHVVAPLMAYMAVTGHFAWSPLLLGCAAGATIAASDMIWALQDLRFDAMHGLYSLPVRVGPAAVLMVARTLYSGSVVLLAGAGWAAELPPIYYLGVVVAFLAVRHYDRVLLKEGQEGIPKAFFRCNSAVALCGLAGVVGAWVWRVWS